MLTDHIPLPEATDFHLDTIYTKRTKDGRYEVRYDPMDMGQRVDCPQVLGYLGCSGWEVEAALDELRNRIRVHRVLSSC